MNKRVILRDMENSRVALVLVFILISQNCGLVDCVHCFNCVSIESLGCGQYLDLTLLVKSTARSTASSSSSLSSSSSSATPSSSQKSRREAAFNLIDIGNHLLNSRRKRGFPFFDEYRSFRGSLTNQLKTLSSRKNKTSKYIHDVALTSMADESGRDEQNDIESNLNVTSTTTKSGALFHPEKFRSIDSERNVESYPLTAINKTSGIGEHDGKMGESPTSSLMVECPGNKCLIQRIPTTKGNVFVRTCDVSNDVPAGQCHLVTGVLGASVSVVCVCEGQFCNQNGESGVTFLGSRTSLVIVSCQCAVLIAAVF